MKQMVFLRFEAARFSVDRTAPRDPSSPRRGSNPGLRSMSLSDREAIVSAAGCCHHRNQWRLSASVQLTGCGWSLRVYGKSRGCVVSLSANSGRLRRQSPGCFAHRRQVALFRVRASLVEQNAATGRSRIALAQQPRWAVNLRTR